MQYQIESYTAQQRTYDDLISYSTVDVTVGGKADHRKTETFGDRVSDAFRRSWRDFGYGAQDFAVGFVAALPTLLVLAVLAAVAVTTARAAVRLHKKKAGRPPGSCTPHARRLCAANGNEAETGKERSAVHTAQIQINVQKYTGRAVHIKERTTFAAAWVLCPALLLAA